MHIKVVEAGSWRGPGMDEPVQFVKVSSRGLIGQDRREFLEKRAAAPIFADKLATVRLKPGDIPIHVIAIGATEGYGPNRNGDAFNEATCRKAHETFVKHARFYRNHKNKNPEKSFGKVALSAYNDAMRRVELLVIGNGTKEAAQRNGGLVMRSELREKLARGEPIAVSMACRVAHDVCNNCGNKAPSRRQYCTADTCISKSGKRMFGCRDGLTKVASDGTVQYVENPNPLFFDISEVIRPADRIAYGGLADYVKAASAQGHAVGGAELAEWWAAHGADFSWRDPMQEVFPQEGRYQLRQKLARVLADIERRIEDSGGDVRTKVAGILPAYQSFVGTEDFDITPLRRGRRKRAEALGALARHAVLLPLPAFLAAVTGESREKVAALSASVAERLPGVFGRLISDPQGEAYLRDETFECADKYASAVGHWAACAATTHSLADEKVRERLWQSAFRKSASPRLRARGDLVKAAAAAGTEENLARQYAAYQLSFLTAQAPARAGGFRELCQRVVAHNYLSR